MDIIHLYANTYLIIWQPLCASTLTTLSDLRDGLVGAAGFAERTELGIN
jgi:hypothetical protein